MTRVAFARVKPDQVERLEAWFRELMTRQDEVRETFVQETVRHEQAFIVPGEKGPMLVYVMEFENQDRARLAALTSQLPIDVEHRRVMSEVLAEKLQFAPLYDCALEGKNG
jgi:hypothetical protein